MKNYQADNLPTQIGGERGERLSFRFECQEDWGDIRVCCLMENSWIRAEIIALWSLDRMADFASELASLLKGQKESAYFINEDGNFEIQCSYKSAGKFHIALQLMPNMVDDDSLKLGFFVEEAAFKYFVNQWNKIEEI